MSAFMIARSLAVIATARAELAAIRLMRRMAIGMALVLLGLAGLGYLSAAAFFSLAAQHGAPLAALLVGLGCLVVALLGAFAARWLDNTGALR
jgi:hypothetical protein